MVRRFVLILMMILYVQCYGCIVAVDHDHDHEGGHEEHERGHEEHEH